MLGTVEAPGNVLVNGMTADDPLEWNAYADPSAVSAVFASDVPVSIVPLDATDDVPVPPDLATRLESDHKAGGADLVYELVVRYPDRLRPEFGQQLWDELAALALPDPGLVTWEDATLGAEESGRLVRVTDGRPVRVAMAADRPAVEAALLSSLRRGGPRVTPFEISGQLSVTWDGTTCAATSSGEIGRGVVQVTLENASGQPGGVLVAGVEPPATWDELLALLDDLDPENTEAPPDWVIQGASLFDDTGNGVEMTGTMVAEPATYGPVCVTGDWPDLRFTPGEPFSVGG